MFTLPQSTKAKLQKIDDKAIKVGQKDSRPASILSLSVHLPNSALDMFGPGLRELLYGKGSPGEKALKQAKIEGVDEISDLPSLTRTGQNLLTLNWGEEQSGCNLVVDYGTGDAKSNIALKNGTTNGFKISLQEGGSVKIGFRFHAPVDHLGAEALGRLHLMHQRDVKITLVGPEVDQADIEDDDQDEGGSSTPPAVKSRRGGTVLTPIQALKNAEKTGAANGSGKAAA